MLTLSLLRHAKSSWKNPALPDRERPLNARGMGDAPAMGRTMSERGIDPELVLCSSAQRTVDTLALVLPELKIEPKVIYEDALLPCQSRRHALTCCAAYSPVHGAFYLSVTIRRFRHSLWASSALDQRNCAID